MTTQTTPNHLRLIILIIRRRYASCCVQFADSGGRPSCASRPLLANTSMANIYATQRS